MKFKSKYTAAFDDYSDSKFWFFSATAAEVTHKLHTFKMENELKKDLVEKWFILFRESLSKWIRKTR